MNTIDLALQPTTGYIKSFTRNTVEGWWELELGIPKAWVYDENSEVGCEILHQNDIGKLLRVFPKSPSILIDDLVAFVEVIIEINKKISDKEKQFTDKMEEMKGMLEKEAKKFYEELDELRETSFKNIGVQAEEKKVRRPRTTKAAIASGQTETYIPPKINPDSIPA